MIKSFCTYHNKQVGQLTLTLLFFRSLQDKTFEAQRRLVNLDLSHNEVEVINQLTFFGLNNLQTLDLSFNKGR